jgi:CubicO group peptidase (beta-lactamase class C family)
MTPSRRDHLRGALALAAATLGAPAFAAEPADPLIGVWSGTLEAEGRPYRSKVTVLAGGRATLTIVDMGELTIEASRFERSDLALSLEWKTNDIAFKGRLTGPDTLEGLVTQDGETHPLVLRRGELFKVDRTVLPPGPLTAARVTQLHAISGAPAFGAAWSFKGGPDRVLVEGRRSADAATAVVATDQWHIGSDTKSMTATLVARLVEAGRLDWTSTVGQVLGPRLPDIDPAYAGANLLHLLSHRAGLGHDAPDPAGRFTHLPLADPRAERLAYAAAALKQPPLAPVGQLESYSNAGFVVAGAMCEAVTGRSWERLMREQVFAPLGLKSGGFGPPVAGSPPRQPLGHVRGLDGRLHAETRRDKAELPTVLGPAGLVHINLGDLLTYLAAHRDRPSSFLTEASWKRLQTPPFGGYSALGWGVDANGSLGHTGSNGLWWAQVLIDRPAGMVFAGVQNAVTPEAQSVMQQALEAARLSRGQA